uniref:Phosphodiesterase n=1 Tax=Trichogramma kaykai TaxID=54128 RepID=A0ABD2WFE4_9HYME
MLRLFITSLTQKSNGNRGSGNNRSNNNDGRGGVGAEWHAGNEEQQEEEDNNDDDGSSTMTASPPKLPLDIIVPPAVLQRRGGMCLTGVIIRAFLQLSLSQATEVMLDQHDLVLRMSEEVIAAASEKRATLCTAEVDDYDDDEDEDDELAKEDADKEELEQRARAIIRRCSEAATAAEHSELEKQLLLRLDLSQHRHRHTGRFLTMHKRRRKRLTTRSLDQEPGLLDDIANGLVQCVLEKVAEWDFNAFTLENVAGGRSLPVLCVHLFHWYGLLEYFKLDVVNVWKLFSLIEEGYHSTNPYHNSIHAADVTQAMHCFLQVEKIRKHLSPLEIMAALIAAVTHDLDHPGVNQPFLVATSNHLATLYQNKSVLENHHWRSAIGCLLESGVADQLSEEIKPDLERRICELILATDITRQNEFLTRFEEYLGSELSMESEEHRHFILQIALKCADISNPCRPWDVQRKWAHKVCEEFFRQGDYERQLNLPVTAVCDRHNTSIPKIQHGFFQFIVLPLYKLLHQFIDDDFSKSLMKNLDFNHKQWLDMIKEAEEQASKRQHLEEELAKKSHQQQRDSSGSEALTDVVQISETIQEDSASLELPLSSSSPRGLVPPKASIQGRRHSVPISLLTLAPRPTTNRRESLPGGAPNQLSSRYSSLQQQYHHRSDGASPTQSISCHSQGQGTSASSSASPAPDRPVSAENLLPEPSIASIANSREAIRLSSLVQQQPWDHNALESQQATTNRQATLTRQQTFPPVQPFARMRYMSTTAEMSQCCTEVLLEGDSSSSRSNSPTSAAMPTTPMTHSGISSPSPQYLTVKPGLTGSSSGGELRRHSTPTQSKSRTPGSGRRFTTIPLTQEDQTAGTSLAGGKFFIGSPPDSPPRQASATPSSDSGSGSMGGGGGGAGTGEPRKSVDSVSLPGTKRDYSDTTREKSSKILKLMKENVDPRICVEEMTNKGAVLVPISNRRSASNQGWARRRGSAPVGLQARLDDGGVTTTMTSTANNRTIESCSRRGSVPADITAQPTEREMYPLNNNLHHASNNANNNTTTSATGSNNNGFGRITFDQGGTTTAILTSRRGSVPADISELRRNSSNISASGKTRRTGSKKLLRRRSSGGPEMFACAGDNADSSWRNKRELKREDMSNSSAQVKRRGSLPVDVLTISFSGRYVHR